MIFNESQWIIILLIAGLVLLGGFAVYFAIRCAKASNQKQTVSFSNVSRLENMFAKQEKRKENRCVFYVGVYLEKAMSVHSESKIWQIYTEIKGILLNVFTDDGGEIAPYEQRNFIALTRWDLTTAEENIKKAEVDIFRSGFKICIKILDFY